jgi:septal ring factor EnvC (AmiA/AmiB activator)
MVMLNRLAKVRAGLIPNRSGLLKHRTAAVMLLIALLFVGGVGGVVFAFSSSARNSLLRSRDEVADQRFQLEKACNDVDRKINELQKQKYTMNHYLQECDRTIREIDRSLNAMDSAYRNMR